MGDTQLVNFECPRQLLEEFDKSLPELTTRSELLRSLIRKYIAQTKEA